MTVIDYPDDREMLWEQVTTLQGRATDLETDIAELQQRLDALERFIHRVYTDKTVAVYPPPEPQEGKAHDLDE